MILILLINDVQLYLFECVHETHLCNVKFCPKSPAFYQFVNKKVCQEIIQLIKIE